MCRDREERWMVRFHVLADMDELTIVRKRCLSLEQAEAERRRVEEAERWINPRVVPVVLFDREAAWLSGDHDYGWTGGSVQAISH